MVEPEMPLKKKAQISLNEELAFKLQAEQEEVERNAREKALEANITEWMIVGEDLQQESTKKQKVDDDQEATELKRCLEIVPDDEDDVTIDATPLFSKSPTISNYKIHKEGRKSYFQIIRVDGSSQMYYTFSKMLKNFNKEDLEVLWSIVKARFEKNTTYYLLVEKMYLVANYTLTQMWNDVRLQVDYEVEMAYDLLRLVRRQLREGYVLG
nr:hypothetical protein [Tanacetum cinerariifolium]